MHERVFDFNYHCRHLLVMLVVYRASGCSKRVGEVERQEVDGEGEGGRDLVGAGPQCELSSEGRAEGQLKEANEKITKLQDPASILGLQAILDVSGFIFI